MCKICFEKVRVPTKISLLVSVSFALFLLSIPQIGLILLPFVIAGYVKWMPLIKV